MIPCELVRVLCKVAFGKRSVKKKVERGHFRKRTKKWAYHGHASDTQVTHRQPIRK